jgi:hypothetical protein
MAHILDNEPHFICSTVYDVEMSLEFDAAPAPRPLHKNEFVTMAGMKRHENPLWFHYTEDCYCNSLQQLPSCILTSSAGQYVHKRDDIWNKTKLIGFLVAQFHRWCVKLSIMSDDVLFAHLSHVSLPEGCVR